MNRQGKATVGSGDHATSVDAGGGRVHGARRVKGGECPGGGAQKTVTRSCVQVTTVRSRDRTRGINARGTGGLGPRGVKGGEGATGGAQKAVRHSVCVMVESRDRAPQVDAKGEGERGARRVKGGDGAVRCPQKTVSPIFKIVPGDRTRWVDAVRISVHCPWNIKGSEGAIGGAQKAVIVIRAGVGPRDDARRVDARSDGPGGSRNVKGDDG